MYVCVCNAVTERDIVGTVVVGRWAFGLTVEDYRAQLAAVRGLDHVTIEINQCCQCALRHA